MSFFCKDCDKTLKDGAAVIEHLGDFESHKIYTTMEDTRY